MTAQQKEIINRVKDCRLGLDEVWKESFKLENACKLLPLFHALGNLDTLIMQLLEDLENENYL